VSICQFIENKSKKTVQLILVVCWPCIILGRFPFDSRYDTLAGREYWNRWCSKTWWGVLDYCCCAACLKRIKATIVKGMKLLLHEFIRIISFARIQKITGYRTLRWIQRVLKNGRVSRKSRCTGQRCTACDRFLVKLQLVIGLRKTESIRRKSQSGCWFQQRQRLRVFAFRQI
jgi:hypothetical protein